MSMWDPYFSSSWVEITILFQKFPSEIPNLLLLSRRLYFFIFGNSRRSWGFIACRLAITLLKVFSHSLNAFASSTFSKRRVFSVEASSSGQTEKLAKTKRTKFRAEWILRRAYLRPSWPGWSSPSTPSSRNRRSRAGGWKWGRNIATSSWYWESSWRWFAPAEAQSSSCTTCDTWTDIVP